MEQVTVHTDPVASNTSSSNFFSGGGGSVNVQPEEHWVKRQLPHYEAEFTRMNELGIACCSFNVGCKKPPPVSELKDWLHLDSVVVSKNSATGAEESRSSRLTDIFLVGLQEVDMSATALLKEETEAAEPWITALREAIGADRSRDESTGHYYPLASRQLVGLLLCVFVRKSLVPHIRDANISTIATGALGTMANKGAVCVSLTIHASTYALINCHLAAGQQHVAKRNEDIDTILQNLQCNSTAVMAHAAEVLSGATPSSPGTVGSPATPNAAALGTPATPAGQLSEGFMLPQDHDVVVLLGDLNYRVELPYEQAVPLSERNDLAPMIAKDQLKAEMRNRHSPWSGFVDCTPKFPPTYRFDFGTSRYDTSEKRRIPAFTDRVLYWSGSARHKQVITETYNASFPKVNSSDHKPIRIDLTVPAKEVVVEDRKRVVERLFSTVRDAGLDRVATAKTTVGSVSLDFGNVRSWEHAVRREVTLTNSGDCVAHVAVSRRTIEDASGGTWMRVRPNKFSIVPGASMSVTVECILDRAALVWLAKIAPFSGKAAFTLKSFLVFTVESGPVHFVESAVNVVPSAVGNTLDNMILLGSQPCAEGFRLAEDPAGGSNPNVRRPQLPKEVWYLCESLYQRAKGHDELFMSQGEPSEVAAVLEHLDTKNEPIPESLASVDSVAQALLKLLSTLLVPVVPPSMQQAALVAGKAGGRAPFNFIMQLPPVHCNVFIYVLSLIKFLMRPKFGRTIDSTTIGQVFARVLLGPSINKSVYRTLQEARQAHQQEIDDGAKLITTLLEADA